MSKTDHAEGVGIVPVLNSLSKSIRALNGHKLAEMGFHIGQDEMLFVMAESPQKVSSLADKLALRSSSISKMSDRLVKKGLLERIADGEDGRGTLLRITDAGIKARASLLEARFQLERDLTRSIDPTALSEVADDLQQLALVLATRLRRIR